MIQQQAQAARRWQRPERTEAELNRICGDAFRAVKIPASWKFREYERIPLEEGSTEIQSICAVFKDMNTTGFNLVHYRLNFHTYSEHLSLVQIRFKEFGKPATACIAVNKTPEQMNDFIKTLTT